MVNGPFGLRRESRTYKTPNGEIDLSDDAACLLIADVADRVSADGFLAFVVAPRFARDTNPKSVRRNLPRFGLHLSALVTFLPGTFTGTGLALELAVIDRNEHDTLFVAEVPADPQAQKELAERLWKRQPGPTARQGTLIRADQYAGLSALEAKQRTELLAKGRGLVPVPFSQAVKEIRVPTRRGTSFERCAEHPYAVYLPEMAASPATTRQEDLSPRLKSYMQLLVAPAVVLPEYLAELLNSPLGHSLRQSVMTGTTIPRINRGLLRESTLYLVPVPDQRRSVEAWSAIQRLRSELSELESGIWERPRQVTGVLEALGQLNQEDRFEDWVETLPFPLASVLRSYHALDRTDKDKYERLLYFFEALTEFCAAVHLSAFRNSATNWPSQRSRIIKVMQDRGFSMRRPTFGLWRAIVELLSVVTREMLNDKEDRAAACSLYATTDAASIEMLTSRDLLGLIQRTNSYRNRWTGHGGAVTSVEAQERQDLLARDLAKLRSIVGTKFLQYQLIEPRDAEILEGPIFRCRVRRVMGSNPQLEHQTIDLTTPAKTGGLYLHNPGHDKALELIPLVEVRDTPQPASYFYNRRDRANLHLVSYHFADDQSEISGTSEALIDLLDELESDSDGNEA